MGMKAQREFYKENIKNRQLEIKAKHAKQQQAIEHANQGYLKLNLLSFFKRQNQGGH